MKVSAVHLRFLSPLEPGLKELFSRFERVMTIEINYSDEASAQTDPSRSRRMAQLAWLLRAETLCDVDCWSVVEGQPLQPRIVYDQITKKLGEGSLDKTESQSHAAAADE